MGGGGAVRVYEISKRLAGRGHEITVVSGRYPGSGDYAEGNLRFRFLGSDKNYVISTFSYAVGAALFVKRHGGEFDIVVEDFAAWNPVFSRFLTDRPAILHVNHREGWGMLKRWHLLGLPFLLVESLYPGLFRYVTALSEGTKKKIKRPDAVVLPAGISGDLIGSDRDAREEDYMLYVGRLSIKNKGLDTLFDALKILPGARLRLIGRGRDEARLRRMGVTGAEFMGFLSEEDKINALKGAKFLVLPSRFEGWGIVVLEAAACGKPVVVSGIPELSFAVEAGFGLSFKTGNPEALAEAMGRLMGGADLRRRMGRRAAEYAKDFTWDSISLKCEAALNDAIKGHGVG